MACAFTVDDVRAFHRRTLVSLGRYRRLSDFVSSALIFMHANPLLRGVLSVDDLRAAPAGGWHGVPAMGALYAHLNRLHRDHDEEMLLVTSAPAAPFVHLANLWMEGGCAARYGPNGGGLQRLCGRLNEAVRDFESCLRDEETAEAAVSRALARMPHVRGTIVCAVDAERGTSMFLDGAAAGMLTQQSVVLPILLVQGRLGAVTGYASMNDDERTAWLQEMGYDVRTVGIGLQFEARFYTALEWAWHAVRDEASTSRGHPLIQLTIPRSLTLPASLSRRLDVNPAHFIDSLRGDGAAFEVFRGWLEGYLPEELVEVDGQPDKDILALCAPPDHRLARTRCRLE